MLLTMAPAHAASTILQIINPLDGTHDFNFTTAQKSVGDTFNINITVTNATQLSGWQVGINWDPSLLNYSNFVMPSDNVFAYDYPISTSSVSSGNIVAGANLGPSATHNFTGSGTLAVLTLQIIQGVSSGGLRQVQCDLSFEGIGSDTFLLSGLGSPDFTPISGHYKYTAPPPPPASLFINPPKVIDPTLIAGTQFNISLRIKNATNVNMWQADVLYDNTILNATNVQEGDFLQSVGTTSFSFTIQQNYNATNGLIQMSCTLTSGGANGQGNLSTITFQVLGLGQCPITLTNVNLLDPYSLPLPFNTANGYFNNVFLAKLRVDPPLVTGPLYVPGTTFTINVTLEQVQDFKMAVFNLTYVPSVVQEIDINVPSVLGQTPIKKLVVDDSAGYIWANLTYPSGISTLPPVTLMTVQFQVLAMGVSPLNLNDTLLYDIGSSPITHEVYDGIFIGIIRDIAVTNVTTDMPIAYQGWNVTVNVTVKNNGNMTETFDIHFYFDANLGQTTTVVNLVPDEVRIVPMKWNTSTVQPCHNYTISATADPLPFEMNLADNNFTDGNVKIRFMGDANGDGVVDMKDIALLIQVFQARPGKPNWDPLYDLDQNGVVDMRDIVTAIMNYNKRCP
jgi:hypothetical protein